MNQLTHLKEICAEILLLLEIFFKSRDGVNASWAAFPPQEDLAEAGLLEP